MDGATEAGLRPPDDDPLRERVERFRASLRTNASADLDSFLPQPGDPLRRAVLEALVKIDLEQRWRRREVMTLEQYAERYLELAAGGNWSPDLLYEEYRVRHQYGDCPSLASYHKRFPNQFEQLRRLVAANPVGTLLASSPPPRQSGRAAVPPPAPTSVTPEVPSDTPVPSASAAAPGPAPAPPPAPPQPPPGLQTPTPGPPPNSDYRLEKLIGRGGFGEVWRALAPGGLAVAVKIIDRPADHEARVREERALDVIKQLRHHFLIQTHAYWPAADRLFIVMDLAEGSLRDRLVECRRAGQRGVPHDELLRYFHEAAEALDYLHTKGVLHRDIKPDNLLVIEGHTRLADFGLARSQAQLLVSVSGSGTPAYMAPEMWRGHAGPPSDQYSLAYSYAELRLGRRPFTSSDYAAVMFDHLEHIPDLGDLPQPEKDVLLKALAKKPAQRYATCTEFARALEAAAAQTPPVPNTMQHAERAVQTSPGTPTLMDGESRPRTESEAAPVRRSTTDLLPSEAAPGPTTRKPRRRVLAALLLLLVPAGAAAAVGGMIYLARHPRGRAALTLEVPDRLTVPRGQPTALRVGLRRQNFTGPLKLHFRAPPGIDAPDVEAGAGQAEVSATLTATETAPEQAELKVDAAGEGVGETATVALVIPPGSPPRLPHRARPVGNETVKDFTGTQLYKKIVVETPGVPPVQVPFVLIPQQTAADLPSYYMMKHKVSNALVAAWRRENRPEDPRQPPAGAGADWSRLPAVGMKWHEAKELARWLGGVLPSPQQWDNAAALDKRPSPTNAAVGRRDSGPRPVDEFGDDLSPLGVADLLGNGTEFTSAPPIKEQGSAGRSLVILRGQRWTAPGPLTLQALQEQQQKPDKFAQVQYEDSPSPFTGLRVVLEPP
jgi:serine/threonine protein kinase